MCEEAFLLPGKAFPTNVAPFITGRYKGVVVVHLAVTFLAADGRFVDGFRVDSFGHCRKLLIAVFSIDLVYGGRLFFQKVQKIDSRRLLPYI